MHNITIEDDNDNWSHWGDLVNSWVGMPPASRPQTVADLRNAMTGKGVVGIVQGDPTRLITFLDYKNTGPIVIPLPTAEMIAYDIGLLDWIAMRPAGQRRYPLPTFYAVAFGGQSMVDLSNAELKVMARRRLGEYVINECM